MTTSISILQDLPFPSAPAGSGPHNITVIVEDSNTGTPLDGYALTISSTNNSFASPNVATIITNSSGVATIPVSFLAAGSGNIRVASAASPSTIFADVPFVVAAATPNFVVVGVSLNGVAIPNTNNPPNQSIPLGSTNNTYVVRVINTNAGNAPVAGHPLVSGLVSGATGIAIAPASATTNASGEATFTISGTTAGSAANKQIYIQETVQNKFLNQGFDVVATPASIVLETADPLALPTYKIYPGITPHATGRLSFAVLDASGNKLQGQTVTASFISGAGNAAFDLTGGTPVPSTNPQQFTTTSYTNGSNYYAAIVYKGLTNASQGLATIRVQSGSLAPVDVEVKIAQITSFVAVPSSLASPPNGPNQNVQVTVRDNFNELYTDKPIEVTSTNTSSATV